MRKSNMSLQSSNNSPIKHTLAPLIPKTRHQFNNFNLSQPIKNDENALKTLLYSTNTSRVVNFHDRNLDVIKRITYKFEEIKRMSNVKKEGSMERLRKVKKHFKLVTEHEKKEIKQKKLKANTLKKKQTYFYSILPGNNSECIKRCMYHRRNWKENLTVSSINISNLIFTPVSNQIPFIALYDKSTLKQMANHFECHSQISNKQNLLVNLAKYCERKKLDLWAYVPLTILIHFDTMHYEKQFESFKSLMYNIKAHVGKSKATQKYKELFYFDAKEKIGYKTALYIPESHYNGRNLWLIKATNLNRGRCIKVVDSIEAIEEKIKSFQLGIRKKDFEETDPDSPLPIINSSDTSKSALLQPSKYKANVVILQKYIEKPLLYYGRKFDMRIWVLVNHRMNVYAFKEGHLKASSVPYDINSKNAYIHLTNYSVQKHSSTFSMFEDGNEISFQQFQSSLYSEHKKSVSVHNDIFPQLCEIIRISMKSVKNKLNPFHRKHCFEIFGYDFIFDENITPYLLEVNTNPGLEDSSMLIRMLVPRMIDDAFRLTIDDFFMTEYFNSNGSRSEDFQSSFDVDGYGNDENLWAFVCNLSTEKEKFVV